MKQELDKELKALLRGRAIETLVFQWSANSNLGVKENIAHDILHLSPDHADIDQVLNTCQTLLIAYGFKTDNFFSHFSMSAPMDIGGFSTAHFINNSVVDLENETEVVNLVLQEGLLPRFKQSTDNRERLAIILKSLIG